MSSRRSILALDATTALCSAAWTDGQRFVERIEVAGHRHSELILGLIDAVLRDAPEDFSGLTEVAFGAGPGSFTGLRIACGVAQGLGYGRRLPVRPVPSLLALAHATRRDAVVVAMDARMREVYWAAYRREALERPAHALEDEGRDRGDRARWREIVAPTAAAPADVGVPPGDDWIAAGDGLAAYPELGARISARCAISDARLTARAIAELALANEGRLGDPRTATPHYVRDKVALTTAERIAAT